MPAVRALVWVPDHRCWRKGAGEGAKHCPVLVESDSRTVRSHGDKYLRTGTSAYEHKCLRTSKNNICSEVTACAQGAACKARVSAAALASRVFAACIHANNPHGRQFTIGKPRRPWRSIALLSRLSHIVRTPHPQRVLSTSMHCTSQSERTSLYQMLRCDSVRLLSCASQRKLGRAVLTAGLADYFGDALGADGEPLRDRMCELERVDTHLSPQSWPLRVHGCAHATIQELTLRCSPELNCNVRATSLRHTLAATTAFACQARQAAAFCPLTLTRLPSYRV